MNMICSEDRQCQISVGSCCCTEILGLCWKCSFERDSELILWFYNLGMLILLHGSRSVMCYNLTGSKQKFQRFNGSNMKTALIQLLWSLNTVWPLLQLKLLFLFLPPFGWQNEHDQVWFGEKHHGGSYANAMKPFGTCKPNLTQQKKQDLLDNLYPQQICRVFSASAEQ